MNAVAVSELTDYNSVLSKVKYGSPVYLTKEGRDEFAIISTKELNELIDLKKKSAAEILVKKLDEEKKIAEKEGWVTDDKIRESMGIWEK